MMAADAAGAPSALQHLHDQRGSSNPADLAQHYGTGATWLMPRARARSLSCCCCVVA